jgi:hypothetical protein
MIVKLMSEMTLAFCYAEGDNARHDNESKLQAFLTAGGLDPAATKRYFFRISVSMVIISTSPISFTPWSRKAPKATAKWRWSTCPRANT